MSKVEKLRLTFLGAAQTVTGSMHLLEVDGARLLVDCGMFQGGKKQDAKNRPPKQQYIKHLDAVLITHAHLDHTGRLPLLVWRDLICPIYATPATIELTDIVLQDSARIQQGDAERINRKNQRAGLPPIEPLYTPEDVNRTLQLFKPAPYETSFDVAPGMSARMVEAGHLLGSVSIELTVEENGERRVWSSRATSARAASR